MEKLFNDNIYSWTQQTPFDNAFYFLGTLVQRKNHIMLSKTV